MPFTGKVGDSLFIQDSGGGHRYVILTEPGDNDDVIVVNFTSASLYKDCTVTFKPRAYPRLFSKESAVNYPYTISLPLSTLKNEANKPDCDYRYCPEKMIKLIIGAFQSQFTPLGIQTELKAQYPDIAEKYFNENNLETLDNA
jgi:hypothetical protein